MRDLLLQIQMSPGGADLLKQAEVRNAPIQQSLMRTTTICQYPACIEATPTRSEQYYEGWNLWGQNLLFQSSSNYGFYLRSPQTGDASGLLRGLPFLAFQITLGGNMRWGVITFEACKAYRPGMGSSYNGPIQARLIHGVVADTHNVGILPQSTQVINSWQYTAWGPQEYCKVFPTLFEMPAGKHAFIFVLDVGELSFVRATFRPL